MSDAPTEPRCGWATSPTLVRYHDDEWGVPLRDPRRLFELLILEGAQAGLSWDTILKKRERYREVYDGFDPEIVAGYDDGKVATLHADPGIVRNRLKVAASISNARAWLALAEAEGDPAAWLWSFVEGTPVRNRFRAMRELPAETDTSRRMSRELKRRGFRFVGPTIVYAFMQSSGMVNDHLVTCPRHKACTALAG